MKKILAVDGNSIINRAYFGVRPLTNGKGERTEAVYGMLNMILSQVEKYGFDCVKVAFDLKAPTFRHKMYDLYKSNRHGMEEELRAQLQPAKEVLSALGYEILTKEGYEADDLLGTISQKAEDAGDECYVFTGDRDSLQLISDRTKVLLATKGETVFYDRSVFFEKYGIMPEQFVDAKALMGDTSDCIPGVPGIGEKTALPLIAEFGSLDRLYADLENPKIKTGVRNKLKESKDSAYLSKTLAQICREVPVELHFEDSKREEQKLYDLLVQMEFSSFIHRLGLSKEEKTAETAEYQKAELQQLLSIEGTVGVVLEEDALYVSCEKGEYLLEHPMASELFAFFENKRKFVVYDCKSLQRTLLSLGISDVQMEDDPMLASYVLSSSDGDYSFKALCLRYLGVVYEGRPDAKLTLQLSKQLEGLLLKEGAYSLYKEVELPLSSVLARMEDWGFLLDTEHLAQFSKELEEEIKTKEKNIYFLAGGEPFNINSPKQLGVVLFEKLQLPVIKKTKSGYSTNAEVLEKLRKYHEIIDEILEYRQLTKLHSTYAEGLLKVADEQGRVHTSFTQTVTATGRLSSVEPNLQNIPVRTTQGRMLRKFFVAPEGSVLIDADYSQIELRILASMAKDRRMTEAFQHNVDIHAVTASEVFGVPIEEVTSDMRKKAKAVNFGIVYGISDFSLSDDIHVSKKEAAAYIKGYFDSYPQIDDYLKNTVKEAKEQGFVTTLFHRKRAIPELSSGKAMLVKFGERVAMNSPIQGTAADVIKIAMLKVDAALRREKLNARLILQVHDELVLECSIRDAERAAALLKKEMEEAVSLEVPLQVDLNTGASLYDCK